MAGPVLSRSQTCLSCLRRLNTAVGTANANSNSVSLVQSRGKRTGRPRDQGVVVRLLEDIPKWGRKDTVFRVDRGRMRNLWYPGKRAEYMTASRFHELGLNRNDIGERDHFFDGLPVMFQQEPKPNTASETLTTTTPTVEVKLVAPRRAHGLLQTLVPPTLTFYRKPIHPVPPPRAPDVAKAAPQRSPLITRLDTLAPTEPEAPAYDPAIFGSVSADMIVADIKGRLMDDAEASRIVLEPSQIKFLGLGGGADRLKALGRWQIEISLGPPPRAGQKPSLGPVKKTIEILPEEEASAEPTTSE